MKPQELGKKYDKIAQWWHEQHQDSRYGIKQLDMALKFASEGRLALDVGCGAGGRIVRKLEEQGFAVTGLDVSEAMVKSRASTSSRRFFSRAGYQYMENGENIRLHHRVGQHLSSAFAPAPARHR